MEIEILVGEDGDHFNVGENRFDEREGSAAADDADEDAYGGKGDEKEEDDKGTEGGVESPVTKKDKKDDVSATTHDDGVRFEIIR